MLGLPKPYPEELLYSTIARAGVHDGETSPKQLLDKVFGNRKVIATVDLPSHIHALTSQYPSTLGLDTKTLISKHTLWPLYAPFHPRTRNEKIERWMCGNSKGAAHLASGIAASRVKSNTHLNLCPECLIEQKSKYGECFWNRLWQVPLVKVCPQHGPLYETSVELNGEHRHTYIPIESAEILNPLQAAPVDNVLAKQVALLIQEDQLGIEFDQWTLFYKNFVVSHGFMNGLRIDYAAVRQNIIQYWGKERLESAGILPSNTETSWIRHLLRKHRKSFSFAEHIVATVALSAGSVSIVSAIDSASKVVVSAEDNQKKHIAINIDTEETTQDQQEWKSLLNRHSPKQARKLNKALYARLYRNHYDWLLYIDEVFHVASKNINQRVDWPRRDREIAQELRRIYEALAEDLHAPHLSRTFLIHQLNNRATVEKNFHRLPRCSKLLDLYSESTDEYQARRLARAYLSMKKERAKIKRWSLLRRAGLSEERMTDIIADLLKVILNEQA